VASHCDSFLARSMCSEWLDIFWQVGGVSVTTFLGLTGFLLAGLVATANAAVISFLMCLSAVGAFLAMFCTSLAVIYVGGLAATAVAIGSAVVVASSAILFVTGLHLYLLYYTK
jgi:hypothetical protein